MLIVKISCVFFLCLSFVLYLPDNETIEPPYTYYSYTITLVKLKRATPAFRRRLLYWVAYLILPIVRWGLQRLEPLITSDNWNLQPPLELWKDLLVKEYEEIFRHFDFSVLPIPNRGPKRNTLPVYAKVFLINVNQKLHYSSELPNVRNLNSVKNIYTIAAILNNVHILQKAPSQSTQKPGEEDPQSLGVLRV